MDIEQVWKQHAPGNNEFEKLTNVNQLHPTGHVSSLKRMKTTIQTNVILGIAIGLSYLVIIAINQYWQIQILLGILLLFTIWTVIECVKFYKGIDIDPPVNNLLTELQRTLAALKKWKAMQNRVGLLIYPVGIAAGFLMGGIAGSGKSLSVLLSKPASIPTLIITMIVLTPICNWFCRVLFKLWFGSLEKQLEKAISELTTDPEF